jgi:hypothetical protein
MPGARRVRLLGVQHQLNSGGPQHNRWTIQQAGRIDPQRLGHHFTPGVQRVSIACDFCSAFPDDSSDETLQAGEFERRRRPLIPRSSLRRLPLIAVTDSLKDGSDRGVDVLDVVGGLTVANEVMHDTSDETANGEGLVVN